MSEQNIEKWGQTQKTYFLRLFGFFSQKMKIAQPGSLCWTQLLHFGIES